MKTFIWADDNKAEYNFFVSVAETIEEARSIVIDKIKENKSYLIGKELDDDNSMYYNEWVEYINTENPVIINEHIGAVFTHANP